MNHPQVALGAEQIESEEVEDEALGSGSWGLSPSFSTAYEGALAPRNGPSGMARSLHWALVGRLVAVGHNFSRTWSAPPEIV